MLVFAVCLCTFLFRGPYRYLQAEPGDNATNYSAGRCWLKGQDPYDHAKLNVEFHAAGGPAYLTVNQHERASIYPPGSMPFFAAVSWMPWRISAFMWLLLSLALISVAAYLVIAALPVSAAAKWLTGSVILVESSTALFGLLTGNPSIPAVALTVIAIYAARQNAFRISGVLLGCAASIKPQVAIVAVVILAIWRYWRPLMIALGIVSAATLAGMARAGSFQTANVWWQDLQTNIRLANAPTGVADFSPFSSSSWQMVNVQAIAAIFVPRNAVDLTVWIVCGLLLACYIGLRVRTTKPEFWADVAFFACFLLLPVYHRAYDATVLLLVIPFVVFTYRTGMRALAAGMAGCLLILGSPYERWILRRLGTLISGPSIRWGLLIHLQAVLVLLLTMLVIAAIARQGFRASRRSTWPGQTATGNQDRLPSSPSLTY